MVKQKIKEWLKRYLLAEIVGTVTALASASTFHLFSENLILVAYAGSIGEAYGFYFTVFIQNLVWLRKKQRVENIQFSLTDIPKIISHLLLEFGPAGIIDGFLLRPFFMYLFPILLNNFTLGILIGKVTGDVAFYFLVILSYELKKRGKKINSLENLGKTA